MKRKKIIAKLLKELGNQKHYSDERLENITLEYLSLSHYGTTLDELFEKSSTASLSRLSRALFLTI